MVSSWTLGLSAHGQNLLSNPGFEDPFVSQVATGVSGQVAQGWADNTSWASGISVAYSRDTATKRGGASSQRIDVQSGFAQFVQWMPLTNGRTHVSVWMRSAAPMWAALYVRGSGFRVYGSTPVRVDGTWRQVKLEALTSADAEGGVFVNTAGTGTLWLDDASLTATPSDAPSPRALTPPSKAVPSSFFGMHPGHMYEAPFLPWPSVPFGTARSHDCSAFWAMIEPNAPINGVHAYDWSTLDAFVASARSRGVRIVYTIYQTPAWAATSSAADPYGAAGGASMPAQVSYYSSFAGALATRYRGQIAAYEVWNEPDISFWTGTPEQMAQLEAACVSAVRAADPQALIVSPPTSGGGTYLNQLAWFERFLAAGGGQGTDVIACHLYSDKPEDDLGRIDALRQLLGVYGLGGKPIWNCETGLGYDGSSTPGEVAAYVSRTYVLNWAKGLDLMAWYSWTEASQLGIRRDNAGNWTVRTTPAIAYDETRRWLVGATMVSCESDADGVWRATLARPRGQSGTIFWREQGSRTVTLQANARTIRTLDGVFRTPDASRQIVVGPEPVLIEYGQRLTENNEQFPASRR